MTFVPSNLALAIALALTPMAHAQTAAAPVPSQFATAQTVFLASAGAPVGGTKEKLMVNMVYSGMYDALTSLKQYRLVTAPADADLSMEVSVVVAVGAVNGTFNNVVLRLVVRDTKTHALLWTLDEPLDGAFREKTFQRNVDSAATKITADLKSLAEGKEPQA
jgi:hypothetical protein